MCPVIEYLCMSGAVLSAGIQWSPMGHTGQYMGLMQSLLGTGEGLLILCVFELLMVTILSSALPTP